VAHNKHFGIVLNVFDVVGIVVDSVDVRISVRFEMPLPRRLRYSECFSMLILSKDYGELKKTCLSFISLNVNQHSSYHGGFQPNAKILTGTFVAKTPYKYILPIIDR